MDVYIIVLGSFVLNATFGEIDFYGEQTTPVPFFALVVFYLEKTFKNRAYLQ